MFLTTFIKQIQVKTKIEGNKSDEENNKTKYSNTEPNYEITNAIFLT